MRPPSLAIVALAPILWVSLARADSPAHVPTRPGVIATAHPAHDGSRWYGWESLLVDVGAFGIGAAGLAVKSAPLAMAGYGTWLASGPSSHLAHREHGRALGSLGMRLALPIVGAVAGCDLFRSDDPWFGCLDGVATGFFAGIGLASIVDATALAWDGGQPRRDTARRSRITPMIVAGGDVRGLGVAGAF